MLSVVEPKKFSPKVQRVVEQKVKKYLFVGDQPSKKNLDPNQAFIGTPSHNTLLKWFQFWEINPSEVELINQSHPDFAQTLHQYAEAKLPIVTLGRKAKDQADKLHVRTKYMPHPSPKNRVLNNQVLVAEHLYEVALFLTPGCP